MGDTSHKLPLYTGLMDLTGWTWSILVTTFHQRTFQKEITTKVKNKRWGESTLWLIRYCVIELIVWTIVQKWHCKLLITSKQYLINHSMLQPYVILHMSFHSSTSLTIHSIIKWRIYQNGYCYIQELATLRFSSDAAVLCICKEGITTLTALLTLIRKVWKDFPQFVKSWLQK